MKNAAFVVFYTLLIATFALWFGGFTFYISFVIPIGTEILGSARSQGFITQQVTHWLNLTCACAIGVMALESVLCWNRSQRPWREIQLTMVLVIACLLVGLVLLHPVMDRMLVVEEEAITDRAKFYGLHRVYLWLSTFQWVAGWIWLLVSVRGWYRLIRIDTKAE